MYTGYRTEAISLYWYVADFQGRAEDLDLTTDSLNYTIHYAETGWTEIVGSTSVDLTTGRDSLGRYKITYTVAADADVGLYYISWTEIKGGVTRTGRKPFEIIETFLPELDEWNRYSLAMVRDVRELGIPTSAKTDRQVVIELTRAAQYIERMCRRRFGSRYTTMKLDPKKQMRRGGFRLPEYCAWLQSFGSPEAVDTDLSLVKFYSRAIRPELGTPSFGRDDRTAPKIEGYDYLNQSIVLFNSEDFIRTTGLWGYVDPDGTDSGKVPEEIRAVVINVAQKYLYSHMGNGSTDLDGTPSVGDRVIKEKTATQSYELNRLDEGGLEASKYVIGGDTEVTKIILQFKRPMLGGSTR